MMYPDDYAKKAGLSMNDTFSPENQDKMAMVYLEEDGYSKFKQGQMSSEKFANNVAGTWAAMPTKSGSSYHAGVGSNKSLVGYDQYMKQIQASKMQTGGIVNMRGGKNQSSLALIKKSQEQFAEQIAAASSPTVIPVPMGGGGGGDGGSAYGGKGASSPFPVLPAEDSSVVSMEYKYRITMGASV